MAQSRVLVLSHSVAPGARYQTRFKRSGFTASWNVAAPLGQRVPSLIGLSGLPSMLMMRLSRTATSWPQPTAQYGYTLGTSLAPAMRAARTCAWAARRSRPSPKSPPREKPEVRRNARRSRPLGELAMERSRKRGEKPTLLVGHRWLDCKGTGSNPAFAPP